MGKSEIENCKSPEPNTLISVHNDLHLVGHTFDLLQSDSANQPSQRYVELLNLRTGKSESQQISCTPDPSVAFEKSTPLISVNGKTYLRFDEIPN